LTPEPETRTPVPVRTEKILEKIFPY